MNTLKIGNVIIGEGMPKICIPIVENTLEGIINSATTIKAMNPDLVEWRGDFFQGIKDTDRLHEVSTKLHSVLEDIPIIFTIRTTAEGGEMSLSFNEYESILMEASKSDFLPLIDVQVFSYNKQETSSLLDKLHNAGKKIIGSYHDFSKTDSREDLLKRLQDIQAFGVDIVKMAVMPNNSTDVTTLMNVTAIMKQNYSCCPLVTMSMGGLGLITRIGGECIGSDITFASGGKTSAPGQLHVSDIKNVLNLIHENS